MPGHLMCSTFASAAPDLFACMAPALQTFNVHEIHLPATDDGLPEVRPARAVCFWGANPS